MKDSLWISVIAAVVAACAAAISWRMSKKQLTTFTYHNIGISYISLNQIFIDNPELRPYFIEGGKLPNGQTQKAKAIAAMILNILESTWSQNDAMGKTEARSWQKYIEHQIRSVKIVNDLYEEQKEWYPSLAEVLDA